MFPLLSLLRSRARSRLRGFRGSPSPGCKYEDVTGYGDYAWVCDVDHSVWGEDKAGCLAHCEPLQGLPPPECVCDEWVNIGCGVAPCEPTEMKQARHCEPARCDIDEQCVPAPECEWVPECHKDEDCPPGQVCVDEICRELPPSCVLDRDCPPGYACIDGKCEKAVKCTTDADCPAGYFCEEGICRKTRTCISDEECPSGWYCINQWCVECPFRLPILCEIWKRLKSRLE